MDTGDDLAELALHADVAVACVLAAGLAGGVNRLLELGDGGHAAAELLADVNTPARGVARHGGVLARGCGRGVAR